MKIEVSESKKGFMWVCVCVFEAGRVKGGEPYLILWDVRVSMCMEIGCRDVFSGAWITKPS